MKIWLGEELTLDAVKRVNWIKDNFNSSVYKITCDGFLINDYYVEFVDNKYETLYYLQHTK